MHFIWCVPLLVISGLDVQPIEQACPYVLNRQAVTATAWVADLNATTAAMRLVSTR